MDIHPDDQLRRIIDDVEMQFDLDALVDEVFLRVSAGTPPDELPELRAAHEVVMRRLRQRK